MYNTSASLSNTNFKHDNIVEIDNIVYYVDDFGLWKMEVQQKVSAFTNVLPLI